MVPVETAGAAPSPPFSRVGCVTYLQGTARTRPPGGVQALHLFLISEAPREAIPSWKNAYATGRGYQGLEALCLWAPALSPSPPASP